MSTTTGSPCSSQQHLRIDLAVPDTISGLFQLYHADGSWIDFAGGLDLGGDPVLETTLLPGVYYIRVSGYVSDDVNSYTLSLTGPLAGDDFEPNYGMEDATALPLGTTVSSFIFTRHDQDWYRIVTTADGHLVVTLNVPESVDYDLQLRDDLDRFVAVSGHFGGARTRRS